MSDTKIFSSILQDTALVRINTNSKKPSVDLIGACGTSFTIRGLPQDSVVIKADEFPAPGKFFRSEKGENKRSDFIIVANRDNSKWIVFIEMKKSNSAENRHIIQQLKGAECVLTYCRCVAKKFWNLKDFLDESNYVSRFVYIETGNINKRPTKHSRNPIHDKPDNMLKLKGYPAFEFNKLVGRQ